MENKTSGNVPEKKFSTGAISASIWRNNGTSKNGEAVEFSTISLQRRYKDKNDQWQSTTSLRLNDLPKAALVLNLAYEHLVLKSETSSAEEAFEEIVM